MVAAMRGCRDPLERTAWGCQARDSALTGSTTASGLTCRRRLCVLMVCHRGQEWILLIPSPKCKGRGTENQEDEPVEAWVTDWRTHHGQREALAARGLGGLPRYPGAQESLHLVIQL